MSSKDNYSDEDQDYRRIQKSSIKRRRKNDRHRNRQDLNNIVQEINNGFDVNKIEEEEDYE